MRQFLPEIFLALFFGIFSLALGISGLIDLWPMPGRFQQAEGVIGSASADYHYSKYGRKSLYAVKFSLQGNSNQFSYPAYLPNAEHVLGAMQLGSQARVLYSGSDPYHPTLWGLTLDGQLVMEPADVSAERRNEGSKLLLESVLMGVGLVWLLRRSARQRSEDTGASGDR